MIIKYDNKGNKLKKKYNFTMQEVMASDAKLFINNIATVKDKKVNKILNNDLIFSDQKLSFYYDAGNKYVQYTIDIPNTWQDLYYKFLKGKTL